MGLRPLTLGLLSLFAAGCVHSLPRVEVLVIAPHPDDEVLLASGVLERAVKQGRRAAVILMTSGGYTCERNAFTREGESMAALTAIGLSEADVHFLDYPDGYLRKLTTTPLAPVEHSAPDGTCTRASTTSAHHGAKHLDEHTARTGTPAPWTTEALVEDLSALLERLRPRDVYLPHYIDSHSDHSMTYVYFRRALDRVRRAPTVHRGVVHAGNCWPSDCNEPFTPGLGMPPLPSPLDHYTPTERLPVDAQRKRALIEMYPSQTGPSPVENWLMAFARTEEVFFPERFELQLGHWVPVGSSTVRLTQPRQVIERFEVLLDTDSVHVLEAATHAPVATWPRPAGVALINIADREVSLLGEDGFIAQFEVP
jgi:LmbE family N-acetylglucosaminyl deacetylase